MTEQHSRSDGTTRLGRGLSKVATAQILASREQLMRRLTGWLQSKDEAECVLQAAYLRAVEKSHTLRSEEHIVPWFTALVRNLAIDRLRRQSVERRALSELSRETSDSVAFTSDIGESICQCVLGILPMLRASYREILELVELRESSVGEAAVVLGLSPGNARVRLFRARKALRRRLIEVCGACAEHGCPNCWCQNEHQKSMKL